MITFFWPYLGVPFWAGERRISPGVNGLLPPNSPEPIFHNNFNLKCQYEGDSRDFLAIVAGRQGAETARIDG